MSKTKSKFEAAVKKTGGVRSIISDQSLVPLSDEEIRMEALNHRITEGQSPVEMTTNNQRRQDLMGKMGYDFAHIDDLEPHPDNDYSIDMETIENLAASIYESGNTAPLLVRNLPERSKQQILAGERRWRAHKLLRERYGEQWAMVPIRSLGTISDDHALFVLHSDNLMQRVTAPSERAKGFEIIADNLVKLREEDPSFKEKYKGKKTRAILAEQLKVSESTVANELAISRNLSDKGKQLLDDGAINKNQAVNVARLSDEKQAVIIDKLTKEELNDEAIDQIIEKIKKADFKLNKSDDINKIVTSTKPSKDTNYYLRKAKNALRKACKQTEHASFSLLGEIKELNRALEEREQTN